jgi:hypothetical protein
MECPQSFKRQGRNTAKSTNSLKNAFRISDRPLSTHSRPSAYTEADLRSGFAGTPIDSRRTPKWGIGERHGQESANCVRSGFRSFAIINRCLWATTGHSLGW